jgi:hypothetical protein
MPWPVSLVCGRYRLTINPEKLCTTLAAGFEGVRSTLTVHLVRPNEVVASGKHFVHSFGIAHEDMDVARRHECPNWSIAKVRARFVFEVSSSAGITRPGRQQARDRESVDNLPDV